QGEIPDVINAGGQYGADSNGVITVTSPTAGTWYAAVRLWAGVDDARIVLNTNVTTSDETPTVTAGPGQSVRAGAAVQLTSRGSDAEGSVSYQWQQVSGTSVTLTNATTANASFTAPSVTTSSMLVFKVKVTDSAGASNTELVRVFVNAPVPSYTV